MSFEPKNTAERIKHAATRIKVMKVPALRTQKCAKPEPNFPAVRRVNSEDQPDSLSRPSMNANETYRMIVPKNCLRNLRTRNFRSLAAEMYIANSMITITGPPQEFRR